ncbi:DDE-type integrase/transposase/recombinase [Microvirga aerophila]|uniref:DDE-type integrase/transposase/recombinase n=1 Tax=Microvirga aerophila TaxID=670291 RepID=UPI000DF0087B|nr:DDE-type integrase/transposase/recombinase [Microvirga aerophila]
MTRFHILEAGDRIEFTSEDGRASETLIVEELRPGERTYVLRHEGTNRLELPPTSWEAIEKAHEEGRLRRLPFEGKGHRARKAGREDPRPGPMKPDEAVRKAYLDAWDAEPKHTSQSKAAMDRWVRKVSQRPDFRMYSYWIPGGVSVARWARERGVLGHRPPEEMIDRRGKGKRAPRRDGGYHKALKTAALWYWSLDTRTPEQAVNRINVVFDYLDARRKRTNRKARKRQRPSDTAIRKKIKEVECYDTWMTKWGGARAVERWHAVGEGLIATKPLEIVIFDHTKSDAWVIYDPVRKLVRGRPWVTLAIDVFTRIILACFVTYRRPCTSTATELVMRINQPKNWIKDKFAHLENGMEAYGKATRIVVDHEWAHKGPSFRQGMKLIGTGVEWPRKRNPQAKAIGEKIFDTINKLCFHRSAGSVPLPAHILRRWGYDPSKTKTASTEEFEANLFKAICDVYQMEPHPAIGKAPLQAWREETEGRHIPVVDNIAYLKAALGRVKKDITLDKAGLVCNGVRYHDQSIVNWLLPELARGEPICSQRKAGSAKASGLWGTIDPENIDHFNLYVEGRNRFVTINAAADHAEYVRDLPEDVYEAMKAANKAANKAFHSPADRARTRNELCRMMEKAVPARQVEARLNQHRLREKLADLGMLQRNIVKFEEAPSSVDGRARPLALPVDLDRQREDRGRPPKQHRSKKAAQAQKAAIRHKKVQAAIKAKQCDQPDPAGDNSPAQRPQKDWDTLLKVPDPEAFMNNLGPGWGSTARATPEDTQVSEPARNGRNGLNTLMPNRGGCPSRE